VKYSTDSISNENKNGIRVSQPKSRLIANLALGFLLLMAASVFAQERQGQPGDDASVAPNAQAATNLMLAATSIRTETDFLSFGFNPVAGFAPTTFVCPSTHKAGCTILVDVSAGIWNVSASSVAQIFVKISGPGAAVDPNSFVNVSVNTRTLGEAATFQFMKRQIPAGSSQTVNIYFEMGLRGATANTGFRTATAQLYLN
jgi:hypothetical protein